MSRDVDVAVCGSLNVDLFARVQSIPALGETVIGRSFARLPGGKGLNQAIAAARLGARTAMIGAVGADADGDSLRALLQDEGIDTAAVRRCEATATGLAQVWVTAAGENCIVVHPGANASLTAQDTLSHLPRAAVYLAQCEIPVAAVDAYLQAARARGGVRILNVAPVPTDVAALLTLADVVVLNEIELAAVTTAVAGGRSLTKLPHGEVPAMAMSLARRMLVTPAQTIVVTLGAAGAVAVTHAHAFHVPAPQSPVVDTTGAGDCFCGALAAAFAAGHALPDAVHRATAAATLSVGRAGAAPAMPTTAELEAVSTRRGSAP